MSHRTGSRLGLAALVAVALPLAGSGTAQAMAGQIGESAHPGPGISAKDPLNKNVHPSLMKARPGRHKAELTVMTQNLYLGSSLDPATQATDGTTFVLAVAQVYGTMISTNFPKRATALAETIKKEQPDLVGLEEVSNWIAQGTNANPPSYDFLKILQQALAAKGLHYEVASVSHNADVGPVPLASPTFGCVVTVSAHNCVVTMQDRDVILVNEKTPGLRWWNPQNGHYAAQQTFQPPAGFGGPVSFDRGWASIDGALDGKKFHYADTHLEVEGSPVVQEAQAREFLAGPARGPGAVIATGDFNSAANGTTTTSYAELTKSWFRDSWSVVNPHQAGLTCCHETTLANPHDVFTSRIDLVLTHGAVQPLSSKVVGGHTPFEAVPPLWPSDHAGVVAKVLLH